jgi:uracil-DNA glycosylase
MEEKCDESCRLGELARQISVCPLCDLAMSRTKAVPGDGPAGARIMLIGEAPGAEEDLTGKPFVGRAGRVMDRALDEAGIDRSKIFITSAVKCRPPKNRQPKCFEIEACHPYLQAQIDTIKPLVICLMGNVAAKTVINRTGIMEMRGELIAERFLVTFHPAAVLRNQDLKEAFMADLKKLAQIARHG